MKESIKNKKKLNTKKLIDNKGLNPTNKFFEYRETEKRDDLPLRLLRKSRIECYHSSGKTYGRCAIPQRIGAGQSLVDRYTRKLERTGVL